jgi:hypothetical protein
MLLDVSGSKYKNKIEKIPQTSKIFKKKTMKVSFACTYIGATTHRYL